MNQLPPCANSRSVNRCYLGWRAAERPSLVLTIYLVSFLPTGWQQQHYKRECYSRFLVLGRKCATPDIVRPNLIWCLLLSVLLCLSAGQIHLHVHRRDQTGAQARQHCCQGQCCVQAHLRKIPHPAHTPLRLSLLLYTLAHI